MLVASGSARFLFPSSPSLRISCKLHDFLVQLPQIRMHLDLVLGSKLPSLHTVLRACRNGEWDLRSGGILLAAFRGQRAKVSEAGIKQGSSRRPCTLNPKPQNPKPQTLLLLNNYPPTQALNPKPETRSQNGDSLAAEYLAQQNKIPIYLNLPIYPCNYSSIYASVYIDMYILHAPHIYICVCIYIYIYIYV